MKILLKILAGLAALVLLLVLVAFLLPRHYRVERSLVIKAGPAAILAPVADLRAWRAWAIWYKRDPDMKTTSSTPPTGVGSWISWTSKSQGDGKMTLTEVTPAKVAYTLEFPDMGMAMAGGLELAAEGDGQRVHWVSEGDLGMNPMNRWFGLFLDRMIGPDFDAGLANLKQLVEK